MRELTMREIDTVSGGSLSGSIVMGVAGGWASAVTGFAIGSVVAGPAGGLIGAGGGFLLGGAVTTGYALATDEDQDS